MLSELLIYKLVSISAGVLFAFMGYKLFCKGIFGDAGHVEVDFGDNKILLKRAAPGTFFAVIGGIIVMVSLYKGFTTSVSSSVSSLQPHSSLRSITPSEFNYSELFSSPVDFKSSISIGYDPGINYITEQYDNSALDNLIEQKQEEYKE